MTDLIGVWGAAGCGRGLMPLLRAMHPASEAVFVDDGDVPLRVNGHAVMTWPTFRAAGPRGVCLGVAAPAVRARLAARADEAGVPLLSARDPSVTEMDEVEIADGACLSPHVVLTSNIRIGRAVHANVASIVEHDCTLGDFVTFGPGVRCNGAVAIGDRAYVGAGAMLRQGVTVGADAVVGMGAVVVRDVPPGATVAGNPARPLRTRGTEGG